jgi:hypothetical protein
MTYGSVFGTSQAIALPTTGLIAHWSFEEGTGTTALDSTGSHNGAISGAQYVGDVAPVSGGAHALRFDGSNDRVTVADSSDLVFHSSTDSFAISAWIKFDAGASSTDATGLMVMKGLGSGLSSYIMGFTTGSPGIPSWNLSDATSGNNNFGFHAGTSIVDGAYHNLIGMWDANTETTSLYIDGVLGASFNVSGNFSGDFGLNTDLVFGSRAGAGNHPSRNIGGVMDEIRIYNRSLSTDEIAQLAGVNTTSVTEPFSAMHFFTFMVCLSIARRLGRRS